MKPILYLCAGFGNPIGSPTLDQLEDELRWQGIRQDVPTPSDAPILVSEFVGRTLHPIFLVGSFGPRDPIPSLEAVVATAQEVDDRCYQLGISCAVEVLNETDITTMSPQQFASYVTAVRSYLRPQTRVISGGITSTSKNALAYLRAAMPYLPETVTVGVHTYRSGPPTKPLPGFSSRQEEFDELHSIVGPRYIWNTEIGWSTAPRKSGCFGLHKTQLTDAQVHDDLLAEYHLCAENEIEVMTVYQWADGPDPNNSYHRFGIIRTDGTLKPSAYLPQEV